MVVGVILALLAVVVFDHDSLISGFVEEYRTKQTQQLQTENDVKESNNEERVNPAETNNEDN